MTCYWKNSLQLRYNIVEDNIEFYACTISKYPFYKENIISFLQRDNIFSFLRKIDSESDLPNCTLDQSLECQHKNFNVVEVSCSYGCNIACSFCFVNQSLKSRNYILSKKDILKSKYYQFFILKKLKGNHLKRIRLSDFCEPFLYKKEVVNFIKSLTKNDCEVLEITTNGTLLDSEVFKAIDNSEIKFYIGVSLNAFSDNLYYTLTKTHYFNKVLDNIYNLKSISEHNKNIALKVSWVITKEFFEKESIRNVYNLLLTLNGIQKIFIFEETSKEYEKAPLYNILKSHTLVSSEEEEKELITLIKAQL